MHPVLSKDQRVNCTDIGNSNFQDADSLGIYNLCHRQKLREGKQLKPAHDSIPLIVECCLPVCRNADLRHCRLFCSTISTGSIAVDTFRASIGRFN